MPGEKWNKSTFTIFSNDWKPENVLNNCHDLVFIICQQEKSPSTGKIHWQGYYECRNRLGIKGHKTNLGDNKAHIEKALGTAEQNIEYCSKSDSKLENGLFYTWGKPAKQGQGARNDLLSLKEDLDKGHNLVTIADNHFECFLKYNKNIKEYILLKQQPRNWKTELIILVGPAGCGKTSWVHNNYPDYILIDGSQTGVWWDLYDGHETVLFDEFTGWIPFNTLLKLTDRYKMSVPGKGTIKNFIAKRLIICSNKLPEEWYPDIFQDKRLWEAFNRRIDKYINYYSALEEHGAPPTKVDPPCSNSFVRSPLGPEVNCSALDILP